MTCIGTMEGYKNLQWYRTYGMPMAAFLSGSLSLFIIPFVVLVLSLFPSFYFFLSFLFYFSLILFLLFLSLPLSLYSPFVDGFLAFYHFGICCVYVVFIAESIKQLVDEYLVVWDVRIHMCLLVVPLLLIFSIRNLKLLAPFSSAANLLLFVGKSRQLQA